MKTTVEYEKKVVARTCVDELVTLILTTEIAHFDTGFIRKLQILAWIASIDFGYVTTPVKKRARNHGVRVRRHR